MAKITIRDLRTAIAFCALAVCCQAQWAMAWQTAAARPNILWLTSEDNSAFWLGCYGNQQAQTPRLDQLAREGVKFNHAYSNAPVCAVARSTLLNGIYAVTQGTQHMRSRYPIPAEFRPYVSYLRDQGYYCTNNAKTDFNFNGDDKAIWDECSDNAHYMNREPGQPFFAIFNVTQSHESSLFPKRMEQARKSGNLPRQNRVPATAVNLPGCVPELPEIRQDFSNYHDVMTLMDQKIRERLDELDEFGLADNTIVFYFSDHGGPTPRGKRYLENSGVQVPLIVRVPEKWKSLCPVAIGHATDELVSFVDFAPTVLSLVGLEKPQQMQGRAFLGTNRTDLVDDAIVFLFADRFDEIVGMRRGITDGRYKYIRRFTPWLPAAPHSYYPLEQPGWAAWKAAAQAGMLNGYHQQLWSDGQPVEELFDCSLDPWETNNIASDPANAGRLVAMRERLKQQMIEFRDTGLIPEGLFGSIAGDQPLASVLRTTQFDFEAAANLAFDVMSMDASAAPIMETNLTNKDPVRRYWAVQGCLANRELALANMDRLQQLLDDDLATLRIGAAHALMLASESEFARERLFQELSRPHDEANVLLLVNTMTHSGLMHQAPIELIQVLLTDPGIPDRIREMIQRESAKHR